ncbi:hypothetical protein SAMN05444336_101528 [Albimonas donghaensis]|uniref:Uncharacterized protein n=1 Tax=Albimonas donghaensis TaxID=356660 RepID=A0A1H2S2U7_9RHOB|nr:hypothetical protein [Albimonas donghaensis]SDW25876.1 hypothetical protein SAMN05444336_101528 [Albimonas donghaensis]
MLRILGLFFAALAALALWADISDAGSGAAIDFASLGQRWAELHQPSLIGLQSGLENRVDPELFFTYVLPVLEIPAAGVAAGLSLVCALLWALTRRRRG